MKFFIDECLSDELTDMAIDSGHPESTSVNRRGLRGTKDWSLMPIIIANDFTLVTKNSFDFRGYPSALGQRGLYRKEPLHAGLVCLNGPVGMDLDLQRELFALALSDLEADSDLVNKVLEITLANHDDDSIDVRRYGLPLP